MKGTSLIFLGWLALMPVLLHAQAPTEKPLGGLDISGKGFNPKPAAGKDMGQSIKDMFAAQDAKSDGNLAWEEFKKANSETLLGKMTGVTADGKVKFETSSGKELKLNLSDETSLLTADGKIQIADPKALKDMYGFDKSSAIEVIKFDEQYLMLMVNRYEVPPPGGTSPPIPPGTTPPPQPIVNPGNGPQPNPGVQPVVPPTTPPQQ